MAFARAACAIPSPMSCRILVDTCVSAAVWLDSAPPEPVVGGRKLSVGLETVKNQPSSTQGERRSAATINAVTFTEFSSRGSTRLRRTRRARRWLIEELPNDERR